MRRRRAIGKFISRKFSALLETLFCGALSNDVGQERHKARALYCLGEIALRCCGQTCAATRHDFPVWIKKLFDHLDIFVVDASDLWVVVVFHKFVLERNIIRINIFLRVVDSVILWSLLWCLGVAHAAARCAFATSCRATA